ncbi:MAG: NADH-quinone oxidoreductase subunit J [Thermomicrobia bacterium]|nr:NADH-quinone oxidoreductase subunit J [Thermomicrobia bacterium]MCA1723704.1 NADH-quinone oxidoreductase subunit J [Thermomicrobia bacterium]
MSGDIFFAIFGGLAALTSLLVVLQRNPTHSALFLVMSFLNVACIYVLLGAEFVAVTQIIVYTGAVLVLFLFAVMLVRMEDLPEMYGGHPVQRFVGPVLGVALFLEILAVILSTVPLGAAGTFTPDAIAAVGGNTQALGRSLYSDFLVPFEISSLILLVGAIGAIVLARPDYTVARDREIGSLFTISLGHPQETTIATPSVYTVQRDNALILNAEEETDKVGETIKR